MIARGPLGAGLALLALCAALLAGPARAEPDRIPEAPATVELRIDGMRCGGCAAEVQKVLSRLDGVLRAVVTWDPPRARVTYDLHRTRVRHIVRAIERAGFVAYEL